MFGATAVVGAAVVLAKVAAMLKEAAVAWCFGTGSDLDAFYVALLIPFSLINVAGGSLQTAFIPVYVRVQEREGARAAEALFSNLLLWTGAALVCATAFIVLLAPLYLPHLAAGFSREKIELTFRLLCLTAPLVLLSGLAGVCGAALNAHGRFALASTTPIITTFLVVVLLTAARPLGVYVLPAGLLIGGALELMSLLVGLRCVGIRLCFGDNSRQHLRQVWRAFWPLSVGSLLLSATVLVQLALVARLAAGSVAAWNYANKLVALPLGLTATALGTAAVPLFSRLVAARDFKQLRATLGSSLKLSLATTLPLAAALMLFSEDVTRLVFQRGAFGSGDAQQVGRILFFLALQIPFYVGGVLTARLLTALGENRLIALVSAVSLTVNALLGYWLVQRMGAPGVALAVSLMYVASFLLNGGLAYRQWPRQSKCEAQALLPES